MLVSYGILDQYKGYEKGIYILKKTKDMDPDIKKNISPPQLHTPRSLL